MVCDNAMQFMSPNGSRAFTSIGVGGKGKDRVVINVGGSRHECYISTIQNFPDTRLYWIAETALKMADFDPEGNEFFFDRHPGCFQNILNYCRTGQLHCPNDVCGPLFEQELAFWGVDELMMEPCCWGSYTQHREAHKHLKMFDEIHQNTDNEWQKEKETEMDEEELENYRKKVREMGTLRKFMLKARPKIWSIMEKPYSTRYAQLNAVVSLVVIILSIATFCLETMKYFQKYKHVFEKLEYFYCIFFTLEFIIRLICCPSISEFFKSVMTWIDFISTMQFYVSFISNSGILDFLFVSRLIRIFRIFRFFKNLSGMQVIGQTLKASANELFLLLLIVTIPMVIFSTLMFYAEKHSKENYFHSIPESFWWAIVTMTTVGYGDIAPKSGYGKIIGAFCACSGVLIVALPVSVIGSNFTLYYSYAQARMRLPKRRSPALVTADKALVNNPDESKQDNHPSNEKNGGAETGRNGSIFVGLHGIANYMVDVTVPTRERRDAILPSVNPITNPFKRRRKQGLIANTATTAQPNGSFSLPLANFQGQGQDVTDFYNCDSDENEADKLIEENEDGEDKKNTSMNSVYTTASQPEHIISNHSLKEQTKTLLPPNNKLKLTKKLSKSTGTLEDSLDMSIHPVEPKRYKRIIHGNISRYKPIKLSQRDIANRRKNSQQNNQQFRPLFVSQYEGEKFPRRIAHAYSSFLHRPTSPYKGFTNDEREGFKPLV